MNKEEQLVAFLALFALIVISTLTVIQNIANLQETNNMILKKLSTVELVIK